MNGLIALVGGLGFTGVTFLVVKGMIQGAASHATKKALAARERQARKEYVRGVYRKVDEREGQ